MKPTKIRHLPLCAIISCALATAVFPALAEEQADIVKVYMSTMDLVDGLHTYNEQQETLLRAQEREMAQLRNSIDQIEFIRRQIGPVAERMIQSLETFVELDAPFLITERRARVEKLKAMFERVDVSVAEKFRLVIDAYQEEIKYGSSYEAYSDFIEINGQQRQVDILRWGRVVLAFQTPDQALTGVWDNEAREWKVLDDEYAEGVRDGLRVARKTQTDNLVPLPTRAPTAE